MFKVTVIGLGNPLLKDEGLGVKVVEKLKEIPLPDEVKIVEAGTYWLEDEEILALTQGMVKGTFDPEFVGRKILSMQVCGAGRM